MQKSNLKQDSYLPKLNGSIRQLKNLYEKKIKDLKSKKNMRNQIKKTQNRFTKHNKQKSFGQKTKTKRI